MLRSVVSDTADGRPGGIRPPFPGAEQRTTENDAARRRSRTCTAAWRVGEVASV